MRWAEGESSQGLLILWVPSYVIESKSRRDSTSRYLNQSVTGPWKGKRVSILGFAKTRGLALCLASSRDPQHSLKR